MHCTKYWNNHFTQTSSFCFWIYWSWQGLNAKFYVAMFRSRLRILIKILMKTGTDEGSRTLPLACPWEGSLALKVWIRNTSVGDRNDWVCRNFPRTETEDVSDIPVEMPDIEGEMVGKVAGQFLQANTLFRASFSISWKNCGQFVWTELFIFKVTTIQAVNHCSI